MSNTDQNEMDSLKQIVQDIFGVDIMKKKRERDNVDARMIYSKILRERGYSFVSIASSLKKDHSTIVHYLSVVDFILMQDQRILDRYMKCKNDFFSDKENTVGKMTEKGLKDRIDELTKKLDALILERESIKSLEKKNARFERIIDLLNEKIKEGEEKSFERKLNQIFNEDYEI